MTCLCAFAARRAITPALDLLLRAQYEPRPEMHGMPRAGYIQGTMTVKGHVIQVLTVGLSAHAVLGGAVWLFQCAIATVNSLQL